MEDPPTIKELETFWANIWENNKEHNKEASWIQQQEEANKCLEGQRCLDISVKRTSNWKAPGKDGITNFWIKNLYALHEELAKGYNEVMQNPHSCPAWLTEGVTYLRPKSEDTKHPQNYRPTTCLPIMYKILTSIIADRTYQRTNKTNCYQPSKILPTSKLWF